MINVEGHMPASEHKDWDRFLVLAPIARYASDLSLILRHAAPKGASVLRLDEEVRHYKGPEVLTSRCNGRKQFTFS